MKYEEIQKLKKSNDYTENRINYILPIAIRLYPKSFFYSLKCLVFYLFFEPKVEYFNNGKNILINNYTKNRKDYNDIVNKLKNILGDNYNSLNIYDTFNFSRILIRIKRLIIFMIKDKNIRIASLILYLKTLYKELEKKKFQEKLFISFCDAYFEENLLAQYFKNKTMITITLQHGQYRYIKPGKETADVEAYLNFVSDYIFCWGEKTKLEFLKAKINPKRIVPLGALKDFTNNSSENLNIIDNNLFCIILDGETYLESNRKMLQLANKIAKFYKLNYVIRFHPMNDKKYYLKFVDMKYYKPINSQEEISKKVKFNILHMTGVFVEMLSLKIPFFVFCDEYTEDIFKLDSFCFSTLEEFDNIFYKLDINNEENILEIMKQEYIKFNIAQNETELKMNYLNNLNKLLEKKR